MKTGRKIDYYYQLIPEKIHAILPKIETVVQAEISGYCRDYLLETINIVATRLRKKDNGEYNSAQLQVAYFKNIVPRGDKYLAALIRIGIIQRFGSYQLGSTSFMYAFAPEYNSRYIKLELVNSKLIRRLSQFYKGQNQKLKASVRGRSEQIKHLRNLTISEEVFYMIEEHFAPDQVDNYNYALASAARIMNGAITYSVDKTSKRFHSNITNMPKILSPYLRISGKPLLEIDVKNSQPFLSAGLLLHPERFAKLAQTKDLYTMLQSLKVPNNKDVEHYVSLAASGQIYEYLREEAWAADISISSTPDVARNEIKKYLFRIMFGLSCIPSQVAKGEVIELFIREFPTVWDIFKKLKGGFHEYNRFAILLQRVESYLILEQVAKEIDRRKLGVFLTKHDSIFVIDNVEAVLQTLLKAFRDLTDLTPRVLIEERKERGGEYI